MPESFVSFAGFRFDPATGELTGPTGATRLAPQPARILAILLERRGALATRAELKDALWGDAAVEADMGLNTCIRQIRLALGDEAEQGRFIETLPRRGYRFVAAIDAEPSAHELAAPARSRRRLWATAALAGIVALAFAGIVLAAGRRNHNVAILPLTPQTGDPSWVTEIDRRVTESLVEKLTAHGAGAIGVVGPVTTAPMARDPRPHTEIGKAVNVGFVMSGAVRVSDSTVFVQVIRVSDGVHVYAMRRRVFGSDLDSLTSALARAVAAKVLAR